MTNWIEEGILQEYERDFDDLLKSRSTSDTLRLIISFCLLVITYLRRKDEK